MQLAHPMKPFRIPFVLAALALMLFVGSCSKPCTFEDVQVEAEEGEPLVRIGDTVLHEGYFQILKQTMPNFEKLFAMPLGRQQILNDIIVMELFLKEGQNEGLFEDNEGLRQRIWSATRAVMSQEIVRDEIQRRSREYYEQNKEERYASVEIADIVYLYPGKDETVSEYDKKRLLERARKTREKLTAENFSEIAKTESEDPVGRSLGGRIGPVSYRDQSVQSVGWGPLVEAAFTLSVGEISEPIATDEGVHLIMPVAEKQYVDYDTAKDLLRAKIGQQVRNYLAVRLAENIRSNT